MELIRKKKNTKKFFAYQHKVSICVECSIYSDLAFVFYFGGSYREFVPRSVAKFVEQKNGSKCWGSGIAERWFSVPVWLYERLKGKSFYKVIY